MTSVRATATSISSLSDQQKTLRLAILIAPQAFLVATAAAGRADPLVLALAFGLSMLITLRPDSHVGFFLIALLVWQWFTGVDDVRTPWAIVAAAAILVTHAATAAATIAPPSAALAAATSARWLRRSALVAALAAAVWAVARALDSLDTGGNVALVAGGALALLGLLALVWPRPRL